jgi:RNA polymerase sigma factor (sigma-70 family)
MRERATPTSVMAIALGSIIAFERDLDLVWLDEALDRLGALDPRLARVVELRFFGGLTTKETAEVLEISTATVEREWATARGWLRRELTRGEAT